MATRNADGGRSPAGTAGGRLSVRNALNTTPNWAASIAERCGAPGSPSPPILRPRPRSSIGPLYPVAPLAAGIPCRSVDRTYPVADAITGCGPLCRPAAGAMIVPVAGGAGDGRGSLATRMADRHPCHLTRHASPVRSALCRRPPGSRPRLGRRAAGREAVNGGAGPEKSGPVPRASRREAPPLAPRQTQSPIFGRICRRTPLLCRQDREWPRDRIRHRGRARCLPQAGGAGQPCQFTDC